MSRAKCALAILRIIPAWPTMTCLYSLSPWEGLRPAPTRWRQRAGNRKGLTALRRHSRGRGDSRLIVGTETAVWRWQGVKYLMVFNPKAKRYSQEVEATIVRQAAGILGGTVTVTHTTLQAGGSW